MPSPSVTPFAPTIVAFGKVPSAGDFLRWSSHLEPTPALEAWVYEGMAVADERLGPAWANAYQQGSPQGFVFRGRGPTADRLVAGVMRPSRDSVGRKFPLVIGTVMPAAPFAGRAHLLPLVLGEFLDDAMQIASASETLRNTSELGDVLSRLRPPDMHQLQSLDAEYAAWQRATALETAWLAVFGPAGPARACRAMYVLQETVAAIRGVEVPSTPLGIRFPLGTAGIAAAAFWLDVVQSAARWKTTIPTSLWSWDGQQGHMLLFFGEPNVGSFADVWSTEADSDYVSDLVSDPDRGGPVSSQDPSAWLARLAPSMAHCLQDPHASVERWIATLRA